MDEQRNHELLATILQECGKAAPAPWYPRDYQERTSIARDTLDAALDQLRLSKLVRLTDWVQGRGQGYALTPEGKDLLDNGEQLEHMRRHGTAPAPPPPSAPERPRADDASWQRGEAARAALLQPAPPRITRLLLFLNIGWFVVGMIWAGQRQVPLGLYLDFGGQGPALNKLREEMGELSPESVIGKHEWWRLLSYCFVHAGFLHLFMNMYFLFAVGPMLERMLGSARYLLLYLGSGLVGGCAVLLVGESAVGASGALCGLLTGLGIWVYANRSFLPPDLAATWLRGILINIILIVIISFLPRVSKAGHFGGGIAGALMAYPLVWHQFGQGWKKALGLALALTVPCAAFLFVYEGIEQPRREILEVRAKYFLPFAQAEEQVVSTYNTIIKPLIRSQENMFADQEKVKEAIPTLMKVQQELKNPLELIREPSNYSAPIQKELKTAEEYLSAWSNYYSQFLQTLKKGKLTKGDNDILNGMVREIDRLTREVHGASFLRSNEEN